MATTDTKLANSNPDYKRVSRAVMAECSAQRNKTSRSTLCADTAREELNTSLIGTPIMMQLTN